MILRLSPTIEELLNAWARRTGEDAQSVAEEAIRLYLAAGQIHDVSQADIAATQESLLPELPALDPWSEGEDETR